MPCRADRCHGSLVQAWMVHLKEPEARKSTKPGFRRWRMWRMKTFSPSFPLFFEYQELFGGSTFFSESTTSEIWNPRKNCGEFDGIYGRCYVSLTVYVFLLTCTCDVSMYVDYISLFSTGATSVASFPVSFLLSCFLGITYPVCRIHLPPDRRKASVVSWPSGDGWTRILWQSFFWS